LERLSGNSPFPEKEEKMEKIALTIMSMVLGALLLISPSPALAKAKGATAVPARVQLQLAMRDLWVGHIFWVRNVVLDTHYGDAAAAKVAEKQVVQNAKDIANAISPYYGKPASDKLFKLLAGHYGAIKDYMTATFAGNKAGQTAAVDKLKKNADEIATFLSSANPNWPKATLEAALLAHGGHHIAQIDAISKKDFASEAKTWTAMKDQVYTIADVLANGIVKQFPKKF
jgi:hypothetical protein